MLSKSVLENRAPPRGRWSKSWHPTR